MAATQEWTRRARDKLHNLDLNRDEHQRIYEKILFEFIEANEGSRNIAYDDTAGLRTVGVGFNMDHAGAKEEWRNVFRGSVSFQEVYTKRRHLTEEEIRMLFGNTIQKRSMELSKHHYIKIWHCLRPNERLSIEDAYFNAPSLVRKGTSFHANMHDYVATQNQYFLEGAIDQIKHRSNKRKNRGIQHRRDVEAIMLSSHECPVYIKPEERLEL